MNEPTLPARQAPLPSRRAVLRASSLVLLLGTQQIARGATIVGEFTAPGGLRGYAARYNGQGLALYLTADGQHVLVGTLFDAQGEDLTSATLERLVYEPMAKEVWARLEKSTWIADGRKDAPRIVYMFDGHDAGAVEHARVQWKAAKAAGCEVAYWQQSPEGRWEKKA